MFSGSVISGGTVDSGGTISGLVLNSGNVVFSAGNGVIDGITIKTVLL